MKMLRAISFVTALALMASGIIAQEDKAPLKAVVAEIEGKVEFKDEGSAQWKTLKVGAEVFKNTMISTGFKSTATIKLGEDTIMVKPVTRLSLSELIRTESGTRTKLSLTVGRVKAEVNPSKREKVEFSIKSATATASVRGTGFETDGVNLVVTHGMVQLENNWGQFRYVGSGEYSKIDSDNTVTIPVAVNPENGLERLDEITDQATMESATVTANTSDTSEVVNPETTGSITLIME